MVKWKPRKPVEKPKPKESKVTFIKDFEGSLNGWKINVKKGDTLELLPYKIEWLKKFNVI